MNNTKIGLGETIPEYIERITVSDSAIQAMENAKRNSVYRTWKKLSK